jgi:hypothetical protein
MTMSWETGVRNVHERRLPAPAGVVGALLDDLGSPRDRLWPGDRWPPMVLERPLEPGARGHHGPVRYELVEHRPRRLLHFRFRPSLGLDVVGMHAFEVVPDGADACVLRHRLELHRPSPALWALWYAVIAPMHDAVVEELCDNAATACGGPAAARRSLRADATRRVVALVGPS